MPSDLETFFADRMGPGDGLRDFETINLDEVADGLLWPMLAVYQDPLAMVFTFTELDGGMHVDVDCFARGDRIGGTVPITLTRQP